MANAERTEVFPCTIDEFFSIISDYEKYPEFIPEVTAIKILEDQGSKKLVEFHVNLIKTITYKLWLTTTGNHSIDWTWHSGDLFKSQTGSWRLNTEGENRVRATYSIDARFGMLVPNAITKKVVEVNLPNMMKAYQKRVQQLFGSK